MSTPIYTDKDYLDEQFRTVRLAIADVRVEFNAKHKEHDDWHQRWAKNVIALAGVMAAVIGWFWPH